ncbi:MAG: hypothetical protein AB8B99_00535 [Phormidesmis sp.]
MNKIGDRPQVRLKAQQPPTVALTTSFTPTGFIPTGHRHSSTAITASSMHLNHATV